jgi:sugar/nucleoside kinase (ribokinase family)
MAITPRSAAQPSTARSEHASAIPSGLASSLPSDGTSTWPHSAGWAGVKAFEGRTPRFVITQRPDGGREFEADWGVAAQVRLHIFPRRYLEAEHVHLCTAPPAQQLAWIGWLRRQRPEVTISIDMFEAFVHRYPAASRRACLAADLVFLNQEESDALGWTLPEGRAAATVLKRGPHGADYLDRSQQARVGATQVPTIDTTGAGDILAGSFLALRALGLAPTVALPRAVRIATASVQSFGVETVALRQAIDRVRLDTERMVPVECAS